MLYLILLIEVALTGFFLMRRFKKFQEFKLRFNPKGLEESHHTLVKTGKTKRIQKERSRYHNRMVLLVAIGLTAISLTMFIKATNKVNEHRKNGNIPTLIGG